MTGFVLTEGTQPRGNKRTSVLQKYESTKKYEEVRRSTEEYEEVRRSTRKYQEVPRTYREVSRSTKKSKEVLKSTKKYLEVHRSIKKYNEVSCNMFVKAYRKNPDFGPKNSEIRYTIVFGPQ